MRKQFSELYLRVCAEPKPEQLEKRWQAIEEYCNQDEVDIYNLVKMAYSLSPSLYLYALSVVFKSITYLR